MMNTPTPWVAAIQRNGTWEINARKSFPVATTAGCIGGVEGEANAKRIEECVNACEGIAMPKHALPMMREALRDVRRSKLIACNCHDQCEGTCTWALVNCALAMLGHGLEEPRMMPGQTPYTPEERERLAGMVNDACEGDPGESDDR